MKRFIPVEKQQSRGRKRYTVEASLCLAGWLASWLAKSGFEWSLNIYTYIQEAPPMYMHIYVRIIGGLHLDVMSREQEQVYSVLNFTSTPGRSIP